MFDNIKIGDDFSKFLKKVERRCVSDKEWEFPYKMVSDPIWECSITLLEMIRSRGIIYDSPERSVVRSAQWAETKREKFDLEQKRNLLRSKFPTCLDNPVIGYYPPGGYVGWHTNCNAPGWIILFNWSEEGKGYFKYYHNYKLVTLEDKPGWNARVGRFRPEHNNLLWHCAKTDCRRFSFSYRFDDLLKWQEAVDCLVT